MNYIDFVSGWVAGGLALVTGHPFDTVKTQQQANYTRLIPTVQELYKTEGFRGFYRGVGFPLMATGINQAIFFGVYGSLIKYFQQGKTHEEALKNYRRDTLCAAVCGGLCQLAIANPVEVVKIRQQVEPDHIHHTCSGAVLRKIYTTEGFFGLYRGLSAMVLRDVPAFGAYILTYDLVVNFGREFEKNEQRHSRNVLRICLAGGIAGLVSWLPFIPLDVVKTVLQSEPDPHKYKGIIHCFQVVIKKRGIKSLWRGTTVISIRAFQTNAAIFLGYEETRKFLYYMLGKS